LQPWNDHLVNDDLLPRFEKSILVVHLEISSAPKGRKGKKSDVCYKAMWGSSFHDRTYFGERGTEDAFTMRKGSPEIDLNCPSETE
jgi:hypothetical protein